jgi:CRP-like cAMP-binding protein
MARITRQQQIDRLRGVWLFSQCSKKELEMLARITTPVSVPGGQVLAREGETGGEFAVIVDGSATVTRAGHQIGTLPAGTFFGEMALLDSGARVATVTAETAMTLLVIDRRDFDALISGGMPSVARKMLTVLGQRLREVDTQLAERFTSARYTFPIGV